MARASLACALLAAATAHAQLPPSFGDRVTVSASRLLDADTTARPVLTLTRDEIARLPVSSVAELLAYLTGSGLARRGGAGMQADTGMRGAGFEQVAVLVDGLRVNDPQTGHFHLNVPLPLDAIERVEVSLGTGSAVHGPDAFGGVVAITTTAPVVVAARALAGEHGRRGAALSAPLGRWWAALDHEAADGFGPGTEYERSRASLGVRTRTGGWDLALTAAGEDRRFGAFAFYSQRYPDQWERNTIALLTAVATRPLGDASLAVRAGARQHADTFVLDRARPSWYTNRHRSRTALVQTTLAGRSGRIGWVAGIEAERAVLASARLGNRERERQAAFTELGAPLGRFRASLQLRADRLGSGDWESSPGLGVELDLGGGAVVGVHRGRSFRLPSFTELYYDSPGTVGNPRLEPEHAWSDELLLRAPVGAGLLEVSVFRRRGRDLIDFVLDDEDVWVATNHARAITTGAETSVVMPAAIGPFSRMRLGAAWLRSTVAVDPARSRYALSHPALEASVITSVALPLGIGGELALRQRQPRRGAGVGLVDVRLQRALGRGVLAELDATNLLDRSYEEVNGVPMPGRWMTFALRWRSDAN